MLEFLFFFLGLALVLYREPIQRFTGDFAFAEKWFGAGGTFTAILLVGLLFMVGAVLSFFGVLGFLLESTIGRIFIRPV